MILLKVKDLEHIKEIIKYGFWGGVTTIFNLVLFFLLKNLGMYYIYANILSYLCAVVVNYFFNKKFVFKTEVSMQSGTREFMKFTLVRILSLVIDNGAFFVLVSLLHFEVNITRVVLSAVIIIATYAINKIFIFNTKAEPRLNNET